MKRNFKVWVTLLLLVCMFFATTISVYAIERTESVASDATIVNVSDFGANGNDNEDDRKALQTALDLGKDATEKAPLIVQVPAGKYYISSALRIYSNTTLELDTDATIVRTDDTKGMLVNYNGTAGEYSQLVNVTVSGGTWDGNITSDDGGDANRSTDLFCLWHGNNITITNTTLKSCRGTHFIELVGVANSTIDNVTFKDFVKSSTIVYDYSKDSSNATDGTVSIRSEAIQLEYANETVCSGAEPYDDTVCKNITITNCTFDNCLNGIGNHHAEMGYTDGITITNNTFKNMISSCMNLPNMHNVTVSGNTAENVRAFLRANYGSEVMIENNTITYGYDSVDNALKQDVFFASNSDITLIGNKVYGCGKRVLLTMDNSTVNMEDNNFDLTSFRPEDEVAVHFTDSALTVTNNTVKNAAKDSICVLNSTGTLENNTLVSSGENGISVTDGSDLTLTSNTIQKPAGNGIYVRSATLNAVGNTIDTPQLGIYAKNSTLKLSNNQISASKSQGIYLMASGGELSKNTVSGSAENAIALSNCDSKVTINNNIIKNNKSGKNGIYSANSTFTADKNDIQDFAEYGIYAKGSTVTITENQITKQNKGIYLDTCEGSLNLNTVSASSVQGIVLSACSSITLTDNNISNAVKNGIYVTGTSSAKISGTTILNSGANGIHVDNNSTAELNNNIIEGAVDFGIYAKSSKLNATGNKITKQNKGIYLDTCSGKLVQNTVSGSSAIGVTLTACKDITLSKNGISGAAQHGVYILGNTIATMSGNTISNSKLNGIRIVGNSTVDVMNNTISGSAANGIGTQLSNVTLESNQISDSTTYGIYVDGGTFDIKGNTIEKSGSYDIRIADNTTDGNVTKASGSATGNVMDGKGFSIVATGKVTLKDNCMNSIVPEISKVENVGNGVKITWKAVTGADKYRVYYQIGNGGWKKIADTAETTYTWTGAKGGTTYKFTVRCINSDGTKFTSSYDTKGKELAYVAQATVSGVENTATGVKISWDNTGAAQYRVLYKTGSGDWAKLVDTTSTSYTWTGAKSGTKYSFTVRCLNSDGKYYISTYDTIGKSITYIAEPKLSSVENTATGVKISWAESTGAAKYRVYYKVSGSGWTKIADTASTSYTWTGAKSGTNYTFTVRCLSSDSKSFTSSFDSTGKSITYIAAPKLSSVENVATGVKITWAKSAGAAQYRVYYKVSGGGWTKIADTASTSYTWTGAKSGTNYAFTVRCLSSDSKSFTSSYDSTGKSIVYIAAPKLSTVENVATGVKITWAESAGAAKYRVYYKVSGGGWTKIADTASTSYTWTGAKSGTTYSFTVRCLSSDSKSFTSSYDSTGKSIKYIAAPKISSLTKTSSGVQINCGSVTGAVNYKVYRKTGNGGWQAIGTTTGTSFVDKNVTKGTTYTYTIRCISKDGKTFTSGYDATGKSITY